MRSTAYYSFLRISPRPSSRQVSTPPPLSATRRSSLPPSSSPLQPPQPEPELELTSVGPSVEETLAARRAKRQAIMAKYAGIASQGVSPSPGPSSAVEPPPNLLPVSNDFSQPYSAGETPAESKSRHALISELVY